MTPQHWKELLASLCKTYAIPEKEVAMIIGVDRSTICNWKRTGVPQSKAFRVGRKISDYVKEMV